MEVIIGIAILYMIYRLIFSKPRKCYICGLSFKKVRYKWKLNGKPQWLCPRCNTQMEIKSSKEAFKAKIG